MVYLDMDQVHEIDNELILFRELFKIESDYRNSLLMAQGGRISQHLLEFLVRNKEIITHNLYDSSFKDFIEKRDFIPKGVDEFIMDLDMYRKKAVYSSKHDKKLNTLLPDFLIAFNEILKWFEDFYLDFLNLKFEFKEIKETIRFINNEIKIGQKQFNYNEINNDKSFELNSSKNYQNEEMGRLAYTMSQSYKETADMRQEMQQMRQEMQQMKEEMRQMNNTAQDTNDLAHEAVDTMHDMDDKIDVNTDKIIDNSNKNADEIKENSDKNTAKIIEEIDSLRDELKNLNGCIANLKKDVYESLNNNESEEEEERIITDFANTCVKRIRTSLEDKIVGTHHYTAEEKIIIDRLGESAWKKLSRQSKTFLTTAKVTYNSLEPLGDNVDYSGVCLLVTKALEVELTKRFYKGFYTYLEKNEIPFERYHTSLLEENYNGELGKVPKDHQSLGAIPYILCSSKHRNPKIHEKNVSILLEYSKENLFEDLNDDEIKKTLRKYGKTIKNITFKYRNRAAHVDEIDGPKAKECLDFVIDVKRFLKTMLDSFDKE